jgi:hypothetical protein
MGLDLLACTMLKVVISYHFTLLSIFRRDNSITLHTENAHRSNIFKV